jgi:hypothetical protein
MGWRDVFRREHKHDQPADKSAGPRPTPTYGAKLRDATVGLIDLTLAIVKASRLSTESVRSQQAGQWFDLKFEFTCFLEHLALRLAIPSNLKPPRDANSLAPFSPTQPNGGSLASSLRPNSIVEQHSKTLASTLAVTLPSLAATRTPSSRGSTGPDEPSSRNARAVRSRLIAKLVEAQQEFLKAPNENTAAMLHEYMDEADATYALSSGEGLLHELSKRWQQWEIKTWRPGYGCFSMARCRERIATDESQAARQQHCHCSG